MPTYTRFEPDTQSWWYDMATYKSMCQSHDIWVCSYPLPEYNVGPSTKSSPAHPFMVRYFSSGPNVPLLRENRLQEISLPHVGLTGAGLEGFVYVFLCFQLFRCFSCYKNLASCSLWKREMPCLYFIHLKKSFSYNSHQKRMESR